MPIIIDCSYDELVPIEKLVPHPRNRNNHPVEQLERLAKIIKETKWRHAITVSKRSGFITTGHGRFEVAKMLGMEKVPIDYQNYLNEAEEYQHIIADNEIARWSVFDRDGFNQDLEEIEIDFSQDIFGLQDFEKLESNEKELTNSEIDTDNFGNDLEHTCPKCGFEFND